MTIESICEHLDSVANSNETHRLEGALAEADREMPKLFNAANANQIFRFTASRKAVQSRLNRLLAARSRKR